MNSSHNITSNKKFLRIISRITLTFIVFVMWILFGWNTNNADYYNYNFIYNYIKQNGSYPAVEIGFEWFVKICTSLGMSYNEFLIIYSFIGLLLIANTAIRFTDNASLVLILYFIFPFLLDVVQIRNFMSMAIMIFATRYLIIKGWMGNLKYILLILLATTFHYSSIFYILFLFTKIKSNKKVFFLTFTVIFAGIIVNGYLTELIMSLLKLERYSIYFTANTSSYAKILFVFYFAISLILIFYIYKRIEKGYNYNSIHSSNNEQLNYAEIIFKINILILISYVFLLKDVDFIRLYRNILPLNFILFAMTKPTYRFVKNVNVLVHNWVFIIFLILSSWIFIYHNTFNTVVEPIFNNNILINYLK